MRFKDIPKFVINLEKRPERLNEITQEMRYMSWDFETFKAIDMNGYMGCTLSHLEIFEIAKEFKMNKNRILQAKIKGHSSNAKFENAKQLQQLFQIFCFEK